MEICFAATNFVRADATGRMVHIATMPIAIFSLASEVTLVTCVSVINNFQRVFSRARNCPRRTITTCCRNDGLNAFTRLVDYLFAMTRDGRQFEAIYFNGETIRWTLETRVFDSRFP